MPAVGDHMSVADDGWAPTTFLGRLTSGERRDVLGLGTPRRFDAGDILVHEGAPSDCVFVLMSGVYKVTGSLGSGREALLAIRLSGDIVGELGVTDGRPRSATVRAIRAGGARRIGSTAFLAFVHRHPAVGQAIGRVMVEKLRSATRRRVEFAAFPTPARIARIVLELADVHGTATGEAIDIELPLTQIELAELVGVAEPTMHRILADMRRDGVLQTGYRRLRILDVASLLRLADQ